MVLKRCRLLAVPLILTGVCFTATLLNEANAQNYPAQVNPALTTPAPGEQKLGPDPDKPFLKDLVKDESGGKVEKTSIGKVGDIEVEGNHFYRDRVFRKQLTLLREKQGQAWSTDALEKELVRINKQNKFKLKATVKKGDSPDTVDIHIDVYEKQPWQISGTMDNQGRPRIGTLRGGVQVTNESLFGYGDTLSVQYLGASGTNYGQFGYDLPVNRYGGTIGFIGEFTHHAIDRFANSSDLDTQNYAGALKYTQPFDKKRIWTGDIGVAARHINVGDGHADPRFVFVGLRFNRPDSYGNTNVYLQSFLGERWFGGDSRFWRARGQFARLFNLPKEHKLLFRGAFQVSPDALPAVHMFPMAGEYFVRGYSEGLLYADSGLFGGIEHYWPVPFLKSIAPDIASRVRGVTFFDIAQGWLRNSRGVPNNDTHLISAGLGLRCRLTQYLQGFVDFAWGIGNTANFNSQNLVGPETSSAMRIHFGVRTDVLKKEYSKRNDRSTVL